MGRLEDQSVLKGPLAERTGKHTCSFSLPLLIQALVLSQQLLDMINNRQFILHHLSCRQGRSRTSSWLTVVLEVTGSLTDSCSELELLLLLLAGWLRIRHQNSPWLK